jgi:hypothetical protein
MSELIRFGPVHQPEHRIVISELLLPALLLGFAAVLTVADCYPATTDNYRVFFAYCL